MTVRQRQALVDGLETVTRNCDDEAVSEAAERGRERIAEAQTGDTTELESVLIETCNDVLETINEELAGVTRATREHRSTSSSAFGSTASCDDARPRQRLIHGFAGSTERPGMSPADGTVSVTDASGSRRDPGCGR